MAEKERCFLLHRLDETRDHTEKLLPTIDQAKQIYPGWTIKDMLAHITGWDDAAIVSLRSHMLGRPPAAEAIRSLDEYNALTVNSRKNRDYEHILIEWRQTRQVLHTVIEQMPDDKFLEAVIVPWGEKTTVPLLVDMLRDHEEEHLGDIRKWFKNPDRPLGKDGN